MQMAQNLSPSDLESRLEQAERLLACFQQALGHELPNQLVALQGLMRLLQWEEADQLGPQSRDYLARAGAVALRTQTLVRSLAELGRLRRQNRSSQAASLADAAREAAAELTQLFPDRSIQYHFPEEAPLLNVSRAALCRVLVLLMRNAVQSNSDQSPLRLEIGFREEAPGPVFWVADNGRGLTAPHLRRLQELCAGPPATPEGIDFDLILAAHFVAQWGGTLRVASEPDSGSVFSVLLYPR
jgi:signal transduction histidine kinase